MKMVTKKFTLLFLTLFLSVACSETQTVGSDEALSKQVEKASPSVSSPISYPYQKLSSASYNKFVVIKFKEGTRVRLENEQFTSNRLIDLEAVNKIAENFKIDRVFRSKTAEEYAEETKQLREKVPDLKDRNLFFQLSISDPELAWKIVLQLIKLSIVEIAYMDVVSVNSSHPGGTPNYQGDQGYLQPASSSGIDANFAWRFSGGRGNGVSIIDLEQGWNLNHEDLPSGITLLSGTMGTTHIDHGTAVAGVLVALNNGHGVTGIVSNANLDVISWFRQLSATAIDRAVRSLNTGDIMLLEGQVLGPSGTGPCDSTGQGGCIPEEWIPATFTSIRAATATGIIVVEAAGNGGNDLDDRVYLNRFNRGTRNSNAIIVGAGNATTHSRLSFSNYGSRIDLQGWGHAVTTLGYGDLANLGTNRRYKRSFAGTSAASPIVVGALASLQGIRRQRFGGPATSVFLRDLLIRTGTAQTGNTAQHIGPLPDLRAAINGMGFNRSPTANAGSDQTVSAGAFVILDGSGSSDPDKDPLIYRWSQISGPFVNFAGSASVRATFTAPTLSYQATLIFRLTVNDGRGGSASDTVTITIGMLDTDNDGITDSKDNCPSTYNPSQADNERDGKGDACDPDDDNDGINDTKDNCPMNYNLSQADNDKDGIGDACDPDDDNDGVNDTKDNCPNTSNSSQADNDKDGTGDACDLDDDNDGVDDTKDNCPKTYNPDQSDIDKDGLGDVCDIDMDGDGYSNSNDNCPKNSNPFQEDLDKDGMGDLCDPDDDNDGVNDISDNCPRIVNPYQADLDKDGLGDLCDPDIDGDGLGNNVEDKNKNGVVDTGETDPRKWDTDGDKRSDGDEVYGKNKCKYSWDYTSDPLKKDTDGDYLSDFDEVSKYCSSPRDKNTDKDCLDDNVEVARLLNPAVYQAPYIVLNQPSLNFGSVNRRGKMILVPLKNDGNYRLDLKKVTIKGDGFKMDKLPPSVQEGKQIQVPVTFHPPGIATYNGSIKFETNDCFHDPVSISLTADGLISNLTASHNTIDFKSVSVWDEKTETLTLTNPTSNDPLEISLSTNEPAFFPALLKAKILPNQKVQVPIYFRPYRYGNFKGKLWINGFLAQERQEIEIPLTGFGQGDSPQISVSSTSINFGNVKLGDNKDLDIVVKNSGKGRLYIHQVEVLDRNGNPIDPKEEPANRRILPSMERFVVEPTKQRSLKVRFSPKTFGEILKGTLKLKHNGPPVEGTLTISFEGREG